MILAVLILDEFFYLFSPVIAHHRVFVGGKVRVIAMFNGMLYLQLLNELPNEYDQHDPQSKIETRSFPYSDDA